MSPELVLEKVVMEIYTSDMSGTISNAILRSCLVFRVDVPEVLLEAAAPNWEGLHPNQLTIPRPLRVPWRFSSDSSTIYFEIDFSAPQCLEVLIKGYFKSSQEYTLVLHFGGWFGSITNIGRAVCLP